MDKRKVLVPIDILLKKTSMNVTVNRSKDLKEMEIEWNAYRQPVGDKSKRFSFILGVIAREWVPINISTWENVDGTGKATLQRLLLVLEIIDLININTNSFLLTTFKRKKKKGVESILRVQLWSEGHKWKNGLFINEAVDDSILRTQVLFIYMMALIMDTSSNFSTYYVIIEKVYITDYSLDIMFTYC